MFISHLSSDYQYDCQHGTKYETGEFTDANFNTFGANMSTVPNPIKWPFYQWPVSLMLTTYYGVTDVMLALVYCV